MNLKTVGFLGYGKVARCFAEVFCESKFIDRVNVWVRNLDKYQQIIPANEKIAFSEKIATIVGGSELIVSAVWPNAALEVAELAGRNLADSQQYLDLNTVSTITAENINEIITLSGANFIKGAIMGSINIYGSKVPLMVGGKECTGLVNLFKLMGFNVQHFEEDFRVPTNIKAMRSIFLKGITALLFETVQVSEQLGLTSAVLDSAVDSLTYQDTKETLLEWLRDIEAFPERRSAEMDECIELMRNLHINPTMTMATKGLFDSIRGQK